MPETENYKLKVDGGRLKRALQERGMKRFSIATGFALSIALAILLFLPQSFPAEVTLSVQQPASSTSLLSTLSGQAPSKRYIGILKSRRLAEEIESTYHLQAFYHMKSHRKTIELIMKSVKVEEKSTDGLLVLTLSMEGPPRLKPGSSEERQRVRELAAQVANSYVTALKSYYVETDNDRDSVLLRAGEAEINRAKREYDFAVNRVRDFVTSLGTTDPRSLPSPPASGAANSGESSTAATELVSLYTALARANSELFAAEAAVAKRRSSLHLQLNDLSGLPTDDVLLGAARRQVFAIKAELGTLLLTYAEESPRVIVARERLVRAQTLLDQQRLGLANGLTSEQAQIAAELERLKGRRDSLLSEIKLAAARLPQKRELTTRLQVLTNELQIQFEKRKVAESEFAKMRLGTVSAQSRFTVVDPAIAPERGSPGGLIIGLGCALVGLLIYAGTTAHIYLRLPANHAD